MKKLCVAMILTGILMLVACDYMDDYMRFNESAGFSPIEIADMLHYVSPYLLSHLGIDEDTIINNPLGAPLLNLFDERTWDFALTGAIMGENIYLYIANETELTILYYKGQIIYFTDWPPIGGRGVYPQLLYHDLNGSGRKDLAIIVHAGSGTGVSLSNLHVLSFDDEGNHHITYLLGRDVHEWMTAPMDFEVIEDSETFRFYFAGQSYIIDCFSFEGETLISVGTCSVASFWFEGTQIKTVVAIAARYETRSPIYFGNANSVVRFDGGNLIFDEFIFTPDA